MFESSVSSHVSQRQSKSGKYIFNSLMQSNRLSRLVILRIFHEIIEIEEFDSHVSRATFKFLIFTLRGEYLFVSCPNVSFVIAF